MTSSGQNVDSFKYKRKWLKIKERQLGKYFSVKWSDTLLFNRKLFETDMHENLHTDVFIMSCEIQCDKMNTEIHLQYEKDQIE